jgi:TatD DNase family protein
MLIDSHAHLDFSDFDADRAEVLARAWDAGLEAIVLIGSGNGEDSARDALRLAAADERLWATVGVHPHDAALGLSFPGPATAPVTGAQRLAWEKRRRRVLGRMAMLALHPKVVAIGEVGLDFHYDRSPRELQRILFSDFVRLARRLRLPLVIHARQDGGEICDILEREEAGRVGGIIHCFTGDDALLQTGLKLGFVFGINGILTFPNAAELRRAASEIPLQRLVLETDAPYLTPVPFRGRRNEPARVAEVARALARLRGLSEQEIGAATTANLYRVLALDSRRAGPPGRIAYQVKDAIYLNITNRCTLCCRFCLKRQGHSLGDIPLALRHEPSASEVIEAYQAAGGERYSEAVFCGVGEPLLRPEVVREVGQKLRAEGQRVRVNTDGLASWVHGRDIVSELRGAVDTLSVSLNAPDAATYARLCQPPDAEAAFAAVCDFIRSASRAIPEVVATAVALPGLDLDACEKLATSLGARFRARPFGEYRHFRPGQVSGPGTADP